MIELNPDAVQIAQQRDQERAAGRVRGPLHGVPVMVKDNIATGDRMQTTAASLALVGCQPDTDATVAARLRQAGAVLIGKTHCRSGPTSGATTPRAAGAGAAG